MKTKSGGWDPGEIRAAMFDAGVSQKDIVCATGASKSSVSRWLSRLYKDEPKPDHIRAIRRLIRDAMRVQKGT